jgi:hypothetical protein
MLTEIAFGDHVAESHFILVIVIAIIIHIV